jgi:hypothetical protein
MRESHGCWRTILFGVFTEAILEHGGEALASRDVFAALGERDRGRVLRFLRNLVLFFPELPEAEVVSAPSSKPTKSSKSRERDRQNKRR